MASAESCSVGTSLMDRGPPILTAVVPWVHPSSCAEAVICTCVDAPLISCCSQGTPVCFTRTKGFISPSPCERSDLMSSVQSGGVERSTRLVLTTPSTGGRTPAVSATWGDRTRWAFPGLGIQGAGRPWSPQEKVSDSVPQSPF